MCGFRGNGKLLLNYDSPAYAGLPKPQLVPNFVGENSEHFAAWDEATLWFVLLLNSGYADLLQHCVHCARPLLRARAQTEMWGRPEIGSLVRQLRG